MDKTAVKNFAVWARKKLISDISYQAALLGITKDGIAKPLPQSNSEVEFYDIGTATPNMVSGSAISQRRSLVDAINNKAANSDYKAAYNSVIEEVAYTWFNRLIAIRFMEVNNYLPGRIRVLSSESSKNKIEPDIVTTPFDADLQFTEEETARLLDFKAANKLDDAFRLIFIKECNALNKILPFLFEKTNDYTELLLNLSVTDTEGVLRRLLSDIPEEDFDVDKGGQVEIIGWLYQYYNTEPKDETFALLKKNVKITKERIPSATQLFTPHWIVRYMVENSLGRLWLEGHPTAENLKQNWKYYLDEAEQVDDVKKQLAEIKKEYSKLNPQDIKIIDPCMGSGHILVYAFDVLMQIYENAGFSTRDAAQNILEHNLYGLDIDKRAFQLAYFALMMKARQYDRRIFNRNITPHVYAIKASNNFNRKHLQYFGAGLDEFERNIALNEVQGLLDDLQYADEYGSIINVNNYNWQFLRQFAEGFKIEGQLDLLDMAGLDTAQNELLALINIGKILAQKYDVVVTNPPYMGNNGMNSKLAAFIKKNYPNTKTDLFACFIEHGIKMLKPYGFNCMVTMQSWLVLSSFETMRKNILNGTTITTLMHMENMVMGIAFGTAVTNLRNRYIKNYKCIYNQIKLQDIENNEPKHFPVKQNCFVQASIAKFSKIPGMPIAFWISEKFIKLYEHPLIHTKFTAKEGVGTRNDDLFLKLFWEVNKNSISSNQKWILTDKAGYYRKWFLGMSYIMDWENDGFHIKNYRNPNGTLKSRPQNTQFLFREGISWGKVGSGTSSFRFREKGFGFNDAAPTIFGNNLLPLLAGLNSNIYKTLLSIRGKTLNVTCGVIEELPLLGYENKKIETLLSSLAKENINFSKSDWDSFETSWDFKEHPLVKWSRDLWDATFIAATMQYYYGCHPKVSCPLELCFMLWQGECNKRFTQLKANEEELNSIFIEIYGLQDELTPDVADKDITVARIYDSKELIPESMKGNNYVLTKQDVVKSLISYAVGCMFGRYSLDVEGLAYAGGEWDNSKYDTFIPDENNCLLITDEQYVANDIAELFGAWLKKAFGTEQYEENLKFVADALGIKGSSSREIIRKYFLTDFIKDHIKTYKKRPIYWLFDSGKQNGFKALIYLHRYNADTIGNLRVDYLHKLQRIYENEIERMAYTEQSSTNAREASAAAKRKEKLQKQLKECREFDEKIAHLALSRIELDLDDGVKVNYEKVQTASDGKKYQVLAKI